MANTKTQAIDFLALALVILGTTAIPKANALVINDINVKALSLNGTTRCSPTIFTDSCNDCAPLANLTVDINMEDDTLVSANTDSNGFFNVNITVGNTINNIDDISKLEAVVTPPIPGCPIWANVTSGRLVGNLALRNRNIVSDVPCLGFTLVRLVI